VGSITADRTVPQLKAFLAAGGTIVAIGSSAVNLARHLELPVADHLVENGQPLPRAKFFVPGSLMSVKVAANHPLTYGMPDRADVFFDESPVFRIASGSANPAIDSTITPLALFDSPASLRSGWAWGQQYLDKGVAALEAKVGPGRVVLFGPEILHRAQPHGTFKLLFNAIWTSSVAK
jgi:hypothetical protein